MRDANIETSIIDNDTNVHSSLSKEETQYTTIHNGGCPILIKITYGKENISECMRKYMKIKSNT